MKKFRIYFLSVLCALGVVFVSCDDDMELTIEASGYNVLKDLKDINADHYFAGKITNNTRIRISFYVYNATESLSGDESLVGEGSVLLDDATAKATFTITLPEGDYQAITVCDLVETSNGSVSREFNRINADMKRPSVLIDKANAGKHLNAFGTAYTKFTFTETRTLPLNPEPAGGLITVSLENIDANDYTQLSYYIDGEVYAKYDPIRKNVTASGTLNHTIYSVNPEPGKDYYHQLYTLPTSSGGVHWGRTGGWKGKELKAVPGVNHLVVIDVTAATATVFNEITK